MTPPDERSDAAPKAAPSGKEAVLPLPEKRLFPDLEVKDRAARDLKPLVAVVTAPLRDGLLESPPEYDNPDIPAGYTYLGQFINHDITTATEAVMKRSVDPGQLRAPGLDLDSLYGDGPDVRRELYQEDQPYRLVTGKEESGGADIKVRSLPRGPDGKALIGDARNDENLILAQVHSAFIDYHNRTVDKLLPQGLPDDRLFREVQARVRKHYQWVMLWDFLPRICGGANVVRDIVGVPGEVGWGKAPALRFYRLGEGAFIPIEFSMAAFRAGHSMVRPSYFLNDQLAGPSGRETSPPYHLRVPFIDASRKVDDLFGGEQIPNNWTIEWKYFFPFDAPLRPWDPEGTDGTGFRIRPLIGPQSSLIIDHEIMAALATLPMPPSVGGTFSLITDDLERGDTFRLPSGQAVAKKMCIPPLTDEQIDLSPQDKLARPDLADAVKPFLADTPLFFYILREAAALQGGRCLGPVGRTLVAETLIGLLWHSKDSILQDPSWRPKDGKIPGQPYTMAHLLTFAYGSPMNFMLPRAVPPWPPGAPVMA